MHNHKCRHCETNFICSEPADECFQKTIVCTDCWWQHEAVYWLFVLFLGFAALGLTIVFFRLLRG